MHFLIRFTFRSCKLLLSLSGTTSKNIFVHLDVILKSEDYILYRKSADISKNGVLRAQKGSQPRNTKNVTASLQIPISNQDEKEFSRK